MYGRRTHITADDAPGASAYQARFRAELAAYEAARCTGGVAGLAALVDFAKESGILIGPGYGGSPSSLILYALGVTAIDPIANNLIFERVSVAAPIVIQVKSERRDDVIAFLDRSSSRDGNNPCEVEVVGMDELSVLAFCERGIRESAPHFRVNAIPRDDRATVELFCRGDTDHIALFDSIAMKRLLRTAHPEGFADLCILDAMYRPPFIGNGLTAETARRIAHRYNSDTANPESPVSEIEEAAEILAETYGIVVYQEQLMVILNRLAGFSLKDAASAVRVFSGTPGVALNELRASFLSAAVANGLTRPRAERLFEFLSTRSPATYNKAHCFAFTTIAWQTAYCRVHYPEVFAQALESSP